MNDISKLQDWINAIEDQDVREIVWQYAENAVLLPTVQFGPIIGREGIARYFIDFMKDRNNLSCEIIDLIKIEDGVLAGVYKFSWDKGQAFARFTFVFSEDGIQLHHSSSMV